MHSLRANSHARRSPAPCTGGWGRADGRMHAARLDIRRHASSSTAHMEMRDVLEHLIARKDLSEEQAERTLKVRGQARPAWGGG